MSRYDLLIRNATLVLPAGPAEADLAVEGGLIAAIGPGLEGGAAAELDARDLHVFPGPIDAHVHFNEPGRAEWEGFASGTRALAAGGATCFFDMPLNAHPPTVDRASFELKAAAASQSALVDWALWGGLVPGNVKRLPELAECGVIGFKAFMSNSGIEDFASVDDGTLFDGMEQAARLGLPVAVHAENDQLTGALAAKARREGRTGVRDYLASRPAVAELEAISRAILFAEATGCALHIVHVSTGRGVALVAEAAARGVDVSCETCPHYLVLTEDDVERIGALAKCAPPLRPQAEQDALWAQIAAGTLPMVASDHSPAPAAMKTGDDFFAIWGGISGCQSTLPLLLDAGVRQRGLPLATVARISAGFVAERFGLERKGRLEVGCDADLALVNLGASAVLEADGLHYRHRHSPYAGMTARGQVAATFLRGRPVFRDGRPVDGAGGRLVRPRRDGRQI